MIGCGSVKKNIMIMILGILLLGTLSIIFINNKKVKSNMIATAVDAEYTDRIPVLTFHRLVPDDVKKTRYKNNQWVGSVKRFEEMMKYLYDNGYKTISSQEFYEWYIGEREYNKKTVMITFDDGFYEDYYLALPILKKYNLKATSFLVGSRIKDKTKEYNKNSTGFIGMDIIEKVRKEYPNFEFQSHSYNMHYYTKNKKHRIKSMSYEELEKDVLLNDRFNFITMAYPYGDFNNSIKEILAKSGYLVAFRFGPSDYATRDSDRFAIPRIKMNDKATVNKMIKWLNY